MKEYWNSHYIRGSRHDTIKGRPDSLYFISEQHGAVSDYVLPVPAEEMRNARSEITKSNEDNEYQEYFNYVMKECNFTLPANWRDSLQLYYILLHNAENGA